MTHAHRLPSFLLGLFVFALAGCGGGETAAGGGETTVPPQNARPAWERSPLALLPRDAFLVAHLDGRQLRASPYFSLVETIFRSQTRDESNPAEQSVGLLLSGTDDVWLSARDGAGHGDVEVLAVLRGAGVESAMRRALAEENPSGAHETKRHAEIWHAGDDGAFVRLDAKTWVISIDGGLEGLLERVEGTAQGDPLGDARLRTTAERVHFSTGAPAAIVAHLPERVRAMLANEGAPLSLLADADYLAARVDASNGLVIDLTADMTSADAAARAEDALRGIVSSYASNPMVALMGLSDILRRIDVRATGARIDVRASTTDEETRSLLQRYGELLGSALSMRESPSRDARVASLSQSAAR